jgi:putative endonuclease
MQRWWERLQNLFTGRGGSADEGDAPHGNGQKSPDKTPLGRKGENHAASYLSGKGFRILTRNYVTPVGEIDIIARYKEFVVFVEVKTRAYDDTAAPEEQVNSHKMHQLTKAAKQYLSRYPVPPPARFDVVSIVWPQGQPPMIKHIEHAFEATF